MSTLVRWMLCLAWMAGICWLWQAGVLGALMAWGLAAPAALPLMLRSGRRRRGELQYVQMAKAPMAIH
ncbi:hypothetical protein ACSFA8_17325 [Variovorax sp. RT4R15]|uniref:hypothetical protein n=1 Tax=Variovorax sp. RT4R15 TaxID=3443737 RepID=UPI003F486DA2